jgi:hypothetical protein
MFLFHVQRQVKVPDGIVRHILQSFHKNPTSSISITAPVDSTARPVRAAAPSEQGNAAAWGSLMTAMGGLA